MIFCKFTLLILLKILTVNKSFCFHTVVAILCSLVQPYSDSGYPGRQRQRNTGSDILTAQAQHSG